MEGEGEDVLHENSKKVRIQSDAGLSLTEVQGWPRTVQWGPAPIFPCGGL